MKRTNIKVFATKTREFRAEISVIENNDIVFQESVTVAGKKWVQSRFDPYREDIIDRCSGILGVLGDKLSSAKKHNQIIKLKR